MAYLERKEGEKTLKCGIVGQSLTRWIIAKCSWIFSVGTGVSNWQHEAEFTMSWHSRSWHGSGPCGRAERGVLYPIQGNNNTTIKQGCISPSYPRSPSPSGLSSWQPLPCLSFGHGSAAKKQLQPWLGWMKIIIRRWNPCSTIIFPGKLGSVSYLLLIKVNLGII